MSLDCVRACVVQQVCVYVCTEANEVLTVVALGPCVGGHGAVAGEVLPQLDADAHVGTRVLLTSGAGS